MGNRQDRHEPPQDSGKAEGPSASQRRSRWSASRRRRDGLSADEVRLLRADDQLQSLMGATHPPSGVTAPNRRMVLRAVERLLLEPPALVETCKHELLMRVEAGVLEADEATMTDAARLARGLSEPWTFEWLDRLGIREGEAPGVSGRIGQLIHRIAGASLRRHGVAGFDRLSVRCAISELYQRASDRQAGLPARKQAASELRELLGLAVPLIRQPTHLRAELVRAELNRFKNAIRAALTANNEGIALDRLGKSLPDVRREDWQRAGLWRDSKTQTRATPSEIAHRLVADYLKIGSPNTLKKLLKPSAPSPPRKTLAQLQYEIKVRQRDR